MKTKKLLFSLLTSAALTTSVTAQTNILPVQGLEANHQGIFAWDVTTVKVGHAIPYPYNAFGNSVAYYYIATRDINNFDPSSTTGMQGTGSLTGFSNLAAALASNGKTISDINIRMATTTLGADVQGADWSLVGAVESRKYTAGSYAILLNNDTLVTGDMPELNLIINYNNSNTPYDDQTSGHTDYSTPVLYANNGIPNAIATAFLNDIGSYKIRLNFSSIQPAGQTEYSSGNTFGGFFVIQSGQIETGSIATQTVNASTDLRFKIFSSLAQNSLQLELEKNAGIQNITIINVLGEQLMSKNVLDSDSKINLEISELKAGVYLCVAQTINGEQITQKFIKK